MSSPKSYVIGAHAFRGYLYLRDAEFSIRDIAAKLGYAQPRIFARQIECVLGERPSKVRHSLEIQECVKRVITWLTEREGITDEPGSPRHRSGIPLNPSGRAAESAGRDFSDEGESQKNE
jgi:hypothetical protein